MNNALLYLGGLLISVLALLFAVPRFVDWNSYRGIFEEEATRILGREVRVGGAVNVRLLPAPYVAFERLRIADVGDDGGNSIIRIESFTMWLSVPPLLRGVVEAHRVELRRPVVNLAANAAGSGNWRTLSLTPGTFPFAPKEVALQSVHIYDGAVIVNGPARGELARFDAINGELTAEALEGPFRFKGDVNWGDKPRHLRLATAKLDANGDLRFKAAVDVAESGNSYVFDGRVSDIKAMPKLDGALTAKLDLGAGRTAAAAVAPAAAPATDPAAVPTPPLPGGAIAPAADTAPSSSGTPTADAAPDLAPPPAAAPTAQGARGFELKAKVKGTTLGVALSEIAVSLDAGTAPQLITGEAEVDWRDKMQFDVALASRWLDLDQLASSTTERTPLEAGRSYFEALASLLPVEADTNARLEFDQLTLGGEPISNVRLAASRSGGPLELKGLRADLPGGVRLELDGILTPSAKQPQLDGALFVSGKSLMRFLAWGLANPEVGRERNDGPFSLDGKFALGDGTLALTDADAELSGTPLQGDLRLDLGERKKLAMRIEGPEVDVAQLGTGLVGAGLVRTLLFGTDAAGTATAEGAEASAAPSLAARLLDPATADFSLDLKAVGLTDGVVRLKDVDAQIRLERGTLAIPRLAFSTPEGLSVEADGEARDVPARPKGALRGLITAPTPDAARAFVALMDLDAESASSLDRVARLAPMRLAATLQLAGGAASANTLALDGALGGGRLVARLALDNGTAPWRTAPLDLQVALDSPDVPALITNLFDARSATPTGAGVPGRVVVKAAGIPQDGLLSLADVTADGLSLRYRGKTRLATPGETGLDGDLEIAATDARTVLALADVPLPDGSAATSLNGIVHIRRAGDTLRLDGKSLTVGTSIVSGEVTLNAGIDGRRSVAAKISTNRASFAALLAPLLGKAAPAELADLVPPAPQQALRGSARQQAAAAAAAQDAADDAPPIWPEHAFDLSLLDRVEGTIEANIGALVVEPGLTIGNARLASTLSPEGIRVSRLTGEAVGGQLTSNVDIERAAAGIGLKGSLRIDLSSTPAALATDSAPPPGDAAAFHVDFSSRALSPAALISALTGKGELTVGDATLNGNSPAAVSAVSRAALTGQGPSGGSALTEAIGEALKQGEVKLGKITIPAEISDGALKLEKVQIEMSEGRSTFVTAVELATMKIDSEWQIEPKLDQAMAAAPAGRAFLPPVTVVYTGKLSQLTGLVPQVSAGALERELVVRKMEFDVGELERLRKLDEERARKDAARRKAEEAERALREAERLRALQEDEVIEPQTMAPGAEAPQPGQGTAPSAPPAPAELFDDGLAGQPAVARPEREQEAAAPGPAVAPSPTSQRPPPRRKRPVEDNWRPFQTPY